MPKESIYANVEKATVSILGKGGQGVLVNDELIITAAHCITYSLEGEMALGDLFTEKIKTHEREFTVALLAVEPVTDIAILGPTDHYEIWNEQIEFERFCKDTNPVTLCRRYFAPLEKFTVHIYTHKGTWVTGSATNPREYAPCLVVEADEQIEGGTSGGPIVNDSGELIGIASNFSDVGDGLPKSWGPVPYPRLALPVWVCRRIFGGN